MLLQFDLKHIHKVNFYPSDNFTQALLVLLVTNMISARGYGWVKGRSDFLPEVHPNLGIRASLKALSKG